MPDKALCQPTEGMTVRHAARLLVKRNNVIWMSARWLKIVNILTTLSSTANRTVTVARGLQALDQLPMRVRWVISPGTPKRFGGPQ